MTRLGNGQWTVVDGERGVGRLSGQTQSKLVKPNKPNQTAAAEGDGSGQWPVASGRWLVAKEGGKTLRANPVKPVKPGQTQSNQSNRVKPVKPGQTSQTGSNQSNRVKPVKPSQTSQTQSNQSNPVKPVKPSQPPTENQGLAGARPSRNRQTQSCPVKARGPERL
jgi:hypothetical protein